jgi:hypothetical protein
MRGPLVEQQLDCPVQMKIRAHQLGQFAVEQRFLGEFHQLPQSKPPPTRHGEHKIIPPAILFAA